MTEVTKETVKAFEDVARHICHISESEPLIIFSVRGITTEGCGRKCEGCLRYLECFPPIPEVLEKQWSTLLNLLMTGKEAKDGES